MEVQIRPDATGSRPGRWDRRHRRRGVRHIAAPVAAPSAATEPTRRGVRSAAPSPRRHHPGPDRRRAPGPTAATSSAGSSASAAAASREQVAAEQKFADDFNRRAEGDLHVRRDLRQQRRRQPASRSRSRPATRRTSSARSASKASTSSATSCSTSQPLIASHELRHDQVRPGAASTSSSIGKDGATSASRSRPTRHSSTTTRSCSMRPKLPYPPTKVGEQYKGKPWDMAAVRELGMKLTVDKNGNDATSADFDPTNIVQWGFDMQWADDARQPRPTIFGASSVVAADGKTAQITDQFTAGLKWFNDGVWKDHFIPTERRRSTATCWPRATRSSPATWPWPRPTAGTPAASTRPRRPSRASTLGRRGRAVPTTASRPPSSTPTPSASSRPPSTRTRRSRPLAALVDSG